MDLVAGLSLVTLVISVVALVLSVAVISSMRFQKRQKIKYEEVKDIVNSKKDQPIVIKDYLTSEEIQRIDGTINADKLVSDLYNTFLKFERNINELNNNFDGILTGFIKELYIEKINNFKSSNYISVKDKINLIGSSITEFNVNELEYRVDISCISYKKRQGQIVSGSETNYVEQIYILRYNKENDKWLISSCNKIFEKKLED